jgi:peptidoglycan hydrolase-like protein with peptidoglycan-binding domain
MADRSSPGRRRALVLAAVLMSALVAAGVVGWFLLTPTSETASGRQTSFTLIEVERRDLTVGTSLPGQFGFGAEQPIVMQATGTVTWLPPAGSRASLGDTLLDVDDRPVVLLYGTTPAFRAMDDGTFESSTSEVPATPPETTSPDGGTSDAAEQQRPPPEPPPAEPSIGSDVAQLESGLAELGYTGFTVDEEFTAGTASAVARWQEDLGIPPTGRVELGDVVFLPGPIRLRPMADALGRPVGEGSVLQTGLTKAVDVETEDASWADAGVRVDVTLPSQRTVRGHVVAVSSAGTDPESGASGVSHVRVELDRAQPSTAPGPVTVTYVTAERKGALVVPVTALVALAEGGYGVELADGGYLGVEPGLYADGVVDAGLQIRVPS